MKKTIFLTIMAMIMFMISCSQNPVDTADTLEPDDPVDVENTSKAPVLIFDTGLKKGDPMATGSTINLGDLYQSKRFYFIIQNGGTEPIKNLEMSFNRDNFYISPDGMNILNVPNEGGGMIPIINISVGHMTPLDMDLKETPLDTGLNEGVLTISGVTADTTFSIEYKFTVNAFKHSLELVCSSDSEEEKGVIRYSGNCPEYLYQEDKSAEARCNNEKGVVQVYTHDIDGAQVVNYGCQWDGRIDWSMWRMHLNYKRVIEIE